MRLLNWIAILFIQFYQKLISPMLGNNCRFYPSCSEYAKQAFSSLNFFTALYKTLWRLLRCHPYAKGGIDPVSRTEKRELFK